MTSVVNVFKDWAEARGDGGNGLLTALAVRAAAGGAEASWRVAVIRPEKQRDEGAKVNKLALALAELKRVQPAIMQV